MAMEDVTDSNAIALSASVVRLFMVFSLWLVRDLRAASGAGTHTIADADDTR
jgi:hypothetical protein